MNTFTSREIIEAACMHLENENAALRQRVIELERELDAARRVIAAARQIDTSRDDGPDELGAAIAAYDATREG